MSITRGQALLMSAVLGSLLCSCTADPMHAVSDPPPGQVSGVPRTHAADPPEDDSPRSPQLAQDAQAHVASDLQRLAKMFVRYAVGDSDSFPHWESVSMAIGGQAMSSIDDIVAGRPNRDIWKICPADWDVYGASSCPVDLLGPINNAVVNDASLVYSAEYGNVICAPTRRGPLPRGRLVVLRPSQEWRTCASDFALSLIADEQGRLRHVDLTLSEP